MTLDKMRQLLAVATNDKETFFWVFGSQHYGPKFQIHGDGGTISKDVGIDFLIPKSLRSATLPRTIHSITGAAITVTRGADPTPFTRLQFHILNYQVSLFLVSLEHLQAWQQAGEYMKIHNTGLDIPRDIRIQEFQKQVKSRL